MKLTKKYLTNLIKETVDRYNSALDELVSKYDEIMSQQRLKPREAVQILLSRDDIKKLIKTIFAGTVGDYGEVLTARDVKEVLRKIRQHKRYKK